MPKYGSIVGPPRQYALGHFLHIPSDLGHIRMNVSPSGVSGYVCNIYGDGSIPPRPP